MSRRALAIAAILVMFLAVPAVGIGQNGNGRFALNGGEAYDRKTGLTWQRCMVGRSWQGGSCAGQQRLMTWFDAMGLKDGGWHVPSRVELESLYQERPGHPKLDLDAFPDAAENQQEYYWTSNKLDSCLESGNRACAEVVGFNGDGGAYSPFGGYPGIFHMPVRLVRNGPPPSQQALAAPGATQTTPDQRWLLRGGEAIDKATGLVWQRCAAGKGWSATLGCQGIVQEYTFEQAVALEAGGWRLPTAKEIETLYYHGPVASGMPLLDPAVFADLDPNHATYWTATQATDCLHCTQSLCGNFKIGWNAMVCDKKQAKLVRLVRSGP